MNTLQKYKIHAEYVNVSHEKLFNVITLRNYLLMGGVVYMARYDIGSEGI